MLKVIYKKGALTGEGIEHCILETLAYFSVFNFPLSIDEIRRFLPPGSNAESLEASLSGLVVHGVIFKIGNVYSLNDQPDPVKRKADGYARAQQLLPKAMKIGRFLCGFPFVRGIGISGGLSKMYAHEKADFDFFIVTKANRLWIARTFMHLFKKLTFLSGKQHYYCMNYFLDENALALRDQNVYTAIETITLIPVCGDGIRDFFAANGWVCGWFTEYPTVMNAKQSPAPRTWMKQLIEGIFNNKLGQKLDNYLLQLTTRRWQKKEQRRELNYEGKEMSLRTGKHFAWSNPDSFQQKVVAQYQKRLKEIKSKWPEYFESISDSFEE